jgi:hypothetical protein
MGKPSCWASYAGKVVTSVAESTRKARRQTMGMARMVLEVQVEIDPEPDVSGRGQ